MFGFRRGFQPPVNFFQFGFDFLQRTAGGEILPHRFVFTVKNNFLRQIADPRPADGQSTAVKRNFAAQQPEKRGLAGAVDADDSRLVPVTELKLGIVKDDLRPERQIHPAALHYFLLLFYGNKKTRFMLRFFEFGGAEEDRTPDLMIANHSLSQLSYSPINTFSSFKIIFVSVERMEPFAFPA